MSRFFAAHSGALQLTRRAWTGHRSTTLTPQLPQGSHYQQSQQQQQQQQVRHYKKGWPQWLDANPTTLAEARAVYVACAEARIFASSHLRPVVSNDPLSFRTVDNNEESVVKAFERTDGLRAADWAARGLDAERAARIALQMKKTGMFKHQERPVNVFANWDAWIAAARPEKPREVMKEAVVAVSSTLEKRERLVMMARRAVHMKRKIMHLESLSALRTRFEEEAAREALAGLQRRVAEALMHLEAARDKAEGVKSKIRPALEKKEKKHNDIESGSSGSSGSRRSVQDTRYVGRENRRPPKDTGKKRP